jgi:signal transduction histidine kinase
MFKLAHILTRCISFLLKTSLKLLFIFWLYQNISKKRTNTVIKHEVHTQMDSFLSVVSHEIRTPLTSVRGNIQLIKKRLQGGIEQSQASLDELHRTLQEVQQLLERIEQQINRLTRIINGFLESARISTNTEDMHFELCEFNALLQEATSNPRYLPDTRKVQVTPSEDAQLLIMADANRIKQVIVHYLTNAHKFSPADTVIEISLSSNHEQLYCCVRDRGLGIPAHEHKHIWERYYRVPTIETLNGSEVGLGIGLHICQAVITQHKGIVGLKSAPGQGSTFWFMLPLFRGDISS